MRARESVFPSRREFVYAPLLAHLCDATVLGAALALWSAVERVEPVEPVERELMNRTNDGSGDGAAVAIASAIVALALLGVVALMSLTRQLSALSVGNLGFERAETRERVSLAG